MTTLRNSFLSAAIASALLSGGQVNAETNAATPAATTTQQGQSAEIGGSTIHYTVNGTGQPLILIHGFPLNSGLFKNQIDALSQNYQLILLDLPGFGRSKANDDDGSLNEYAQTVLGLMDRLKIDKAIIGGHSMGGMTTLEMYRQAPERFSGMILINTTQKPEMLANQAWWRGFGTQAKEQGVASIAPILTPQMLSGEARMNQPELVSFTQGLINAASVDGIEGGGEALAERPDNTEVLGKITVPTLILVGAEDALTPVTLSQEMNKAIKDSQLVIILDSSHASVLEDPKQANDAILSWAAQIKPVDVALSVRGR